MATTRDVDDIYSFVAEVATLRADSEAAPDSPYKDGYTQALDEVWELVEQWLLDA